MDLVLLILSMILISIEGEPTNIHYCMDSKNHKILPGPEDKLFSQCSPWKDNSCCTHSVTRSIHAGEMYGFTYDHCPSRNMSEACRKHFIQDFCFYECSPNVGPWVVKVDMKIRKERFYEVPLCASDCEVWFKDCANDYTCTDNWGRNFQWRDGKNYCPTDAECLTFREIFGTARNFCEKIWDHSWKYTPDDQPCMRIWFDGKYGNPNDQVAEWKVTSGASFLVSSVLISSILLVAAVL